MVDVRVICAILGQLGLSGRLPWESNPESEYKADVRRFFALTRGHVVIAGPRTIASFPDWARSDRSNTVQPSCFCESIKAAQLPAGRRAS
jgi:dihydromethanopterin reductase